MPTRQSASSLPLVPVQTPTSSSERCSAAEPSLPSGCPSLLPASVFSMMLLCSVKSRDSTACTSQVAILTDSTPACLGTPTIPPTRPLPCCRPSSSAHSSVAPVLDLWCNH